MPTSSRSLEAHPHNPELIDRTEEIFDAFHECLTAEEKLRLLTDFWNIRESDEDYRRLQQYLHRILADVNNLREVTVQHKTAAEKATLLLKVMQRPSERVEMTQHFLLLYSSLEAFVYVTRSTERSSPGTTSRSRRVRQIPKGATSASLEDHV